MRFLALTILVLSMGAAIPMQKKKPTLNEKVDITNLTDVVKAPLEDPKILTELDNSTDPSGDAFQNSTDHKEDPKDTTDPSQEKFQNSTDPKDTTDSNQEKLQNSTVLTEDTPQDDKSPTKDNSGVFEKDKSQDTNLPIEDSSRNSNVSVEDTPRNLTVEKDVGSSSCNASAEDCGDAECDEKEKLGKDNLEGGSGGTGSDECSEEGKELDAANNTSANVENVSDSPLEKEQNALDKVQKEHHASDKVQKEHHASDKVLASNAKEGESDKWKKVEEELTARFGGPAPCDKAGQIDGDVIMECLNVEMPIKMVARFIPLDPKIKKSPGCPLATGNKNIDQALCSTV